MSDDLVPRHEAREREAREMYAQRIGTKVVMVNSEGIGPRDHARNVFLQMAASILFNHPLRKSDDPNDMLVVVAEIFPNATTAMIKAGED